LQDLYAELVGLVLGSPAWEAKFAAFQAALAAFQTALYAGAAGAYRDYEDAFGADLEAGAAGQHGEQLCWPFEQELVPAALSTMVNIAMAIPELVAQVVQECRGGPWNIVPCLAALGKLGFALELAVFFPVLGFAEVPTLGTDLTAVWTTFDAAGIGHSDDGMVAGAQQRAVQMKSATTRVLGIGVATVAAAVAPLLCPDGCVWSCVPLRP
jgi:hypothetical protein